MSGWRSRGTATAAVCGGSTPAVSPLQPARQHPFLDAGEVVLALGEIRLPGGRVPDLDPAARPDHHDVAVQPGVLTQMYGYGDPTLLVGQLVVGAGEEDPAV